MKRSYFPLALSIFLAILITEVNCQTTPWRNIGPFMGYVHCMAMDTSHSDTVYAGTPTGVYKSVDGAENWYKTSLTDFEINALKISSNNPGLLIASSDSIVYKSEDYGETWKEIWKSEEYTIGAIAFDPSDDMSIWVGINVSGWKIYTENLYHSSNGGDYWEGVSFPGVEMKLNSVNSILFDSFNDSIMYIIGQNDRYHISNGGAFISNDKGETWANKKMNNSKTGTDDLIDIITTHSNYNPHAVFILYNDGNIDKKLFKSKDFGENWEEINTPKTDYIDRFAYVMEFDPKYPKWLYFGGNYKSEASIIAYNIEADSWHYLPGTPLYYPTSLLMNSKVWYMGFKRDGVFRWDGNKDTSWVSKINGMTDVKTYDIITYPDNPDKILAAIDGSLAKTSDGGQTWELTDRSLGNLALNPQDTSIIYAGAVSSYLPNWIDSYYGYKSSNGGKSWSSIKLFMRDGYPEYGYTFRSGDIVVFPEDPDVILFGVDGGGGAGEGLFKSINGGDTWTREFSTGVTPIAMDPGNNDIVYLGTTKSGSVHKSENRGESWTSMGEVAYNISDLGVDKKGQITAATSEGFYKWDGGTSWSLVSGLPEINTTAIAIDNLPALPVYYVGTEEQGVFISKDGGSTWDSFNEGLKKYNITRLKLTDSNPCKLYAGTEDGGVWVTTLEKNVTSITILKKPKISFRVFPNPNNGRLNIISDNGLKGDLKIINLLGEVIYSKNNIEIGSKKAYEIYVDNVTPGNYILAFIDDNQIIIRKVIFIK